MIDEKMKNSMKLQNDEFDAMVRLSDVWRTLRNIAVVDDDYPQYRHYYESAVREFLRACKANGREV